MTNDHESHDAIPVAIQTYDAPDTEVASILNDTEAPEIVLARLEKAAELAPRWQAAMRQIIMSLTFPADWEVFGEGDKAKVCLSSAGAERVATQFSIQYFEVSYQKEEFTDTVGKGYRYVYKGKAALGAKVIFAQGIYSTRDAFLGKANGEFKDLSEINENDIQTAAYHRFCGNAIKMILGLRAMPVEQYKDLMNRTGRDAKRTTGHTYGSGTKGGTSGDDRTMQKELAEICIAIAAAGYTVEMDDEGNLTAESLGQAAGIADETELGKEICETMSAFIGKDKTKVSGKPASKLSGKRLEISLSKAREIKGIVDKLTGTHS